MKHLIYVKLAVALFVMLASTFGVAGQTSPVCVKENPNASQLERELIKLEQQRDEYVLKGDKEALKRLLPENYLSTSPTGKVMTKTDLLKELTASPNFTHDIDEIQLRESGDTAVINYHVFERGVFNNQPLTTHNRCTRVYTRRNNGWQILASSCVEMFNFNRTVARIDPKIYELYVGEYQDKAAGATSIGVGRVFREGNKLFVQWDKDEKQELLPISETTFFIQDSPEQYVFMRDAQGRITHLIVRYTNGEEVRTPKIK